MSIGKMNRRITLYNEEITQDAGGGTSGVISEQWNTWAYIRERRGSTYSGQATDLTVYDYEVMVRFDGRVTAQTTMVYEGQVCKCNSVSIETEGSKRFMNMLVSKTDTYIDMS